MDRFAVIQEYYYKSILPPPLNLIYHLMTIIDYVLLKRLRRKFDQEYISLNDMSIFRRCFNYLTDPTLPFHSNVH